MNQEQTMNDILNIVEFLKERMVTRDEFQQTLLETKTEIMTHVDGFVVLHQKLDTELVALRAKYDRLEGFVKQLARHANIPLEF
ncbi:hypothetical protein HYV70_01690 [Candidatus Uhrbacteria bacterium]|nr:hypothetical protein [Candidatus Uhrbacteria bacterium]